MNITHEDVSSLSEKLGALDLTEGERALLSGIVEAANQDEVSGFASPSPFGDFLGVANQFVGRNYGPTFEFAESGKKAEGNFAESGKKGEA